MTKPSEFGLAFVRAPMEDDEDTGTWISKELTRVEEANLSFYDAFGSRDIEKMARLWSRSPHARCVHPGWELVIGWNDIRQSWVEIFRTLEEVEFELEDVHVEVSGRSAWANLIAHVSASTDEGESFNASVVTTNIFELQENRWVLVLHHSSNFAEEEPMAEDDSVEVTAGSAEFEPN
ncbi:MAG: nuclear transport factor 2 family protein [Deltaproteobacteria bacterium]|nr:nuclear transport factor 2 family protein [Deltaproteobacteria bacterium]